MRFPRETEKLIAQFRSLPPEERALSEPSAYPIDTLLEIVAERYRIGKPKVEEIVMSRWKDLVGSEYAQRCSPIKITRKGKLVVAVANPMVRRELMFKKRSLLTRLHHLPECSAIKDVVLVAG